MTFCKRRFLRKRTKLTQNETSRTKTDAFSVFSFVQITSPYATPTSPSCSSSNMQNMTRSNCRRKPPLCSPFLEKHEFKLGYFVIYSVFCSSALSRSTSFCSSSWWMLWWRRARPEHAPEGKMLTLDCYFFKECFNLY